VPFTHTQLQASVMLHTKCGCASTHVSPSSKCACTRSNQSLPNITETEGQEPEHQQLTLTRFLPLLDDLNLGGWHLEDHQSTPTACTSTKDRKLKESTALDAPLTIGCWPTSTSPLLCCIVTSAGLATDQQQNQQQSGRCQPHGGHHGSAGRRTAVWISGSPSPPVHSEHNFRDFRNPRQHLLQHQVQSLSRARLFDLHHHMSPVAASKLWGRQRTAVPTSPTGSCTSRGGQPTPCPKSRVAHDMQAAGHFNHPRWVSWAGGSAT
jgi:hypothetical protein